MGVPLLSAFEWLGLRAQLVLSAMPKSRSKMARISSKQTPWRRTAKLRKSMMVLERPSGLAYFDVPWSIATEAAARTAGSISHSRYLLPVSERLAEEPNT